MHLKSVHRITRSEDYDDHRPIETPDDRLKAAIIAYGEVVRLVLRHRFNVAELTCLVSGSTGRTAAS